MLPPRTVPLLWCVTATVVALHVGAIAAERLLGVSRATGVLRQVDLNAEANATAWFGSFLLLLAAALAAAVATSAPVAAAGATRRWGVLTGLLALMSVDETAQLHDLATGPLRAALDTELTVFHFAWVIPALVVVTAAVLYLAPLGRTLPGREAPRLLGAAAVYVAGAVVLEMLGGLVVDVDVTVRGYTLPYLAATTVEESLELVGAVLLVAVLLDVARRVRPGLLPTPEAPTVVR